jgi:hypothetical protein
MFSIENYTNQKILIDLMIKEKLPDWEKTQGFISDGLINPSMYSNAYPKIICLLCESYGWDKEGITNIEKQRRPNREGVQSNEVYKKKVLDSDILGLLPHNRKAVATTRNLCTCLTYVFRAIENNEHITKDILYKESLLRSTISNNIVLQKTLEKIAWINVKKVSRSTGTRQNNDEIKAHFIINRDIIKKQIEIINPDIILAFSEPVESVIKNGKIDLSSYVILYLDHPRNWMSYDKIYNAMKLIERDIKTNKHPTTAST